MATVIDEETAPLPRVAAELHVDPDVLQRAVRRGMIRADRIGGETYISRAEAAVFVENQAMIADALDSDWQAASDALLARYRVAYITLR